MEPADTKPSENECSDLDYWMSRVLRERDRARDDFAPEPVHDLRVALRRCRSIADGFMVFDPHPAWKLMKGAGRQLFQQLGDSARHSSHDGMGMAHCACIRRNLGNPEPAISQNRRRSTRKAPRKHCGISTARSGRHGPGCSPIVRSASRQEAWLFSIWRWNDGLKRTRLHIQAMRNRSHAAYHRLRIGLKTIPLHR